MRLGNMGTWLGLLAIQTHQASPKDHYRLLQGEYVTQDREREPRPYDVGISRLTCLPLIHSILLHHGLRGRDIQSVIFNSRMFLPLMKARFGC